MGPKSRMLLVATPLFPSYFLFRRIEDVGIKSELLSSAIIALLGYLTTSWVLPTFTPFLSRRGLVGKDFLKKGTASADKLM